MKKFTALTLAAACLFLASAPPALAWHGHGGISFGFGFWGPPAYYPPPAYYYPPPVVYAPPPVAVYPYAAPADAWTPAGPVYRDGASGLYCREYQTTVQIDGQLKTGYGTACQQPDGTWRIVP